MMRGFLWICFFVLASLPLAGQIEVKFDKGTVTYISSQNVYVKFGNTEAIMTGDTLYVVRNGNMLPSLLVSNKSSISCVCVPLDLNEKLVVGSEVMAKRIVKSEIPVKTEEEPAEEKVVEGPTAASLPPRREDERREVINGRISVASYSHFDEESPVHRMRYSFSMHADHIDYSRFSAECNVVFRHTLNEWPEVQDNLFTALKIYSLALNYDFGKNTFLGLGRKINSKISSMGAIDGLQFEKGWKHLLVGAMAGARPNFEDYRPDPKLLQAGAYAGYVSTPDEKYHQTTLAFVEQRNHFLTDRRFLYFQHSNALLKNLNIFGSCEMDLFQKVNNEVKNTLSLTNLFVSLQYRLSKKINMSASYDNRKNIIYYESYKNYIDQLIEDETRQGMRLGINIRPFKTIALGVNASWRFQQSGANDSKNLNAFLSFNRVPLLKMSASLTANFLQTGYLDSKMFGLRLNREFLKGKLSGELYARFVDYNYKVYEYSTIQYLGGVSLNFRILRKLGFYVFYEATLDDQGRLFHLFNTKIIQRF